MSEQKFKESKSSLAFSQALIDRMGAEKMPQEEPMMTPEQEMPQEQEMTTPEEVVETPETTEEEPEEEKGESRLERMFAEFMDTMNKFFKREQEQAPKIELTEEK